MVQLQLSLLATKREKGGILGFTLSVVIVTSYIFWSTRGQFRHHLMSSFWASRFTTLFLMYGIEHTAVVLNRGAAEPLGAVKSARGPANL